MLMTDKVNPAISVIIPIFNQEKYLGKCIRSVLCQSFQDFEIILVNDGSTDKSLKICQKYAKQDSRISIIDKNNEGLAFARRDGVMRSKGEYLCFLDSDDYLAPHALESLYDIVLEKNVDVAIGSYDIVFDNWGLLKKKPVPFRILDAEIAKDQIIPSIIGNDGLSEDVWAALVWGRLYRHSCVLKAQREAKIPLYPNGKKTACEDIMFNCALAPFIDLIWISSIVVSHYRYGGVTSRNFPEVRNSSSSFEDRYLFCIQNGYEFVLPRIFNNYSIKLRNDFICQYHYREHSEEKIRQFIHKELTTRKIVIWAQQNSSELPEKMKQDPFTIAILDCNVDGFWRAVQEREQFLRKHHYWKMKLVRLYQKVMNIIGVIIN